MGFLMDGLDAEAYDRTYSDRALVGRILNYFWPQTGRISIVSAAIVANALVDIALPIYISRSLDDIVAGRANLMWVTITVVALGCLSWVFNFVRRSRSAQAVADVVLQLRSDAFDAVLKRDLSFYDQFASGKIVSRVNSDTQAFSQVVVLAMDLVSQLLLVVLLIGYLFTVNLQLTLTVLALAPFIVIVALAFRRIARDSITQARRASAGVSSHIQETISGISVAKTFRQEQAVYDEFLGVNAQSFRINLRTGYVFSAIFPVLNILAGIGTAALVYFGGRLVNDTVLSPGQWFLFIEGIRLFWVPLTSIASFWSQFQLGLAAAER
ncbi:MAG: ABC transporter transmembrane domain-containing protein, partial [Anaerolineales bacterium]